MKSLIILLIVTMSSLIEASKYVIRIKPEENRHSQNYRKLISYAPYHKNEYNSNRHYIYQEHTRTKPHQITIEKPIPYHVYKRIPYPVKVPYNVPVVQKIIVPVPQPYEVPVYRPYPVEVPHETIVEKKVPVYIHGSKAPESSKDVSGCILGSTGYEYPKPSSRKMSHESLYK